MSKKYDVKLTEKERQQLINLNRRGKSSARQLTRARVLLLCDANRAKGAMTDAAIAAILAVSLSTIKRLRRQFVDDGLTEALGEKPRCGRPKRFSGRDAATVTALACSDPPEGYAKWSMRLIAAKLVELDYVAAISPQTVFRILKKTLCLRT